MSRLLLDTQTLIWWDSGSRSLGRRAVEAIHAATAVYVSAASEWELTIKSTLGKVVLQRSVLQAARDAGFEPLPITFEHAQAVAKLRAIHKDPFDLLLVAVASVEGFTLVSSDSILSEYRVTFIDATE